MTPPSAARSPRRRFWALLVLLGVFLAACAEQAPQDTLEPEGPFSQQVHDLFVPVFAVAVVIFVLVQGGILYASWAFRRKRQGEDFVPAQTHGNTRLEIGWTIAPAVILAVIAVPTVSTVLDLAEEPEGALEVTVYGAQWWWEYEYDLGNGQTVVTANELHIPTDRPVQLTMTSRDVIHSYWVPKLAGKKDVVPGRWHTLNLQADEPGEYWGQCVEFCGASHANMRQRLIAHEPADFDDWLAHNAEDRTEPAAGSLEAAGEELMTSRGCTSCHVLRGVSTDEQIAALRGDRLIRAQGDEIPFAPDLTHFGSRGTFAGSLFDTEPGLIKAWLRNPPAEKDGSLMPNLNLSEDDIEALTAYLLSLD